MVKYAQIYFKHFAVLTPLDFWSMFGHFSTLWMKMLTEILTSNSEKKERKSKFKVIERKQSEKYRWINASEKFPRGLYATNIGY